MCQRRLGVAEEADEPFAGVEADARQQLRHVVLDLLRVGREHLVHRGLERSGRIVSSAALIVVGASMLFRKG